MTHNIRIYDNGGKTYDRYTCVFMDEPFSNIPGDERKQALAFDENPFHPLGFGQHTSAMPGRHLGKKISLDDLPEEARGFVLQNIEEQ